MQSASNIRYIWEECLNDEERGITEYLPPAFFSHLSRDTTEGTYSRQRLVRFDLFKTEFLLNICWKFVILHSAGYILVTKKYDLSELDPG